MAVGVRLPGTTPQSISTPGVAAFTPTTSLELIVRYAADSWSGDSTQRSIVGYGTASVDGFHLQHRSNWSGFQVWIGANAGNAFIDPGLSNGTPYWLRLYADGSAITLQYAANQDTVPSSWTTIGTPAAADTFSAPASKDLRIGASSSNAANAGLGNAFNLLLTVDGSLVADWSAPHTGARHRDSTGKIWTIEGSSFSTVITA